MLPLAQNNKEKRTFSIHGPCVAVNLADSGDEYYLKAYAQTFTYAQKIKAEFVVVHTNEATMVRPPQLKNWSISA
mgnify:CR=1 FL=1